MGDNASSYLFYGLTARNEEGPYPYSVMEKHTFLDEYECEDYDYEANEAFIELLKEEFGVGLDTSSSCDSPMPFLYIIMSEDDEFFRTDWNGPIRVDTYITSAQRREWDLKLAKAAEHLGWPKDHRDPGWWLASHWG